MKKIILLLSWLLSVVIIGCNEQEERGLNYNQGNYQPNYRSSTKSVIRVLYPEDKKGINICAFGVENQYGFYDSYIDDVAYNPTLKETMEINFHPEKLVAYKERKILKSLSPKEIFEKELNGIKFYKIDLRNL